jgi:CRISPR-associated protein Cas1
MAKSTRDDTVYIAVADRLSFFYAEKGVLEVDGHAVVLRQGNRLVHLPVATACAVLVMPGTVVTHEAVKACAEEGTLLLWVGENGVRCYAAGNPGGANAGKILRQAKLRLDSRSRLLVAKAIFQRMFEEEAPQCRSVEQLRGMEGARVKALYHRLANEAEVEWSGRDGLSNPINQAISGANAALYGLVEACILALGYSPAIGFVHSGDPRSFVFDVSDCLKFRTVVPVAFDVIKASVEDVEGRVRRACRDLFGRINMSARIIDIIEDVLTHGETCGY